MITERPYKVGEHQKHIDFIINNLRGKDKAELIDIITELSQELTVGDAVWQSIEQSSEVYLGFADGRPCYVWGVANPDEQAKAKMFWIVGTSGIDKYPVDFIRKSKRHACELVGKYGCIYNCAPVEYKETMRWIKCIGAKIQEKFKVNGKDYVLWTLGMEALDNGRSIGSVGNCGAGSRVI